MRTTTTGTRAGFTGRPITAVTFLAAVIAVLAFAGSGLAYGGGSTAGARSLSQSPLTNVSLSANNSGNLMAGQPVTQARRRPTTAQRSPGFASILETDQA